MSRRLLRLNRLAQTAPPGPVSYLSEHPPTCLTFQVRTQESPSTSALPPHAPLPPLSRPLSGPSGRLAVTSARLLLSSPWKFSFQKALPSPLFGTVAWLSVWGGGAEFTLLPSACTACPHSLLGHHGLLAGHVSFTGFPGCKRTTFPPASGSGHSAFPCRIWHFATHLTTHLRCVNTYRLSPCTGISGQEPRWLPILFKA